MIVANALSPFSRNQPKTQRTNLPILHRAKTTYKTFQTKQTETEAQVETENKTVKKQKTRSEFFFR
jgi:hypothetical protein